MAHYMAQGAWRVAFISNIEYRVRCALLRYCVPRTCNAITQQRNNDVTPSSLRYAPFITFIYAWYAMYELLTNGPELTALNPILRASSPKRSNSCGV